MDLYPLNLEKIRHYCADHRAEFERMGGFEIGIEFSLSFSN